MALTDEAKKRREINLGSEHLKIFSDIWPDTSIGGVRKSLREFLSVCQDKQGGYDVGAEPEELQRYVKLCADSFDRLEEIEAGIDTSNEELPLFKEIDVRWISAK